MHDWQTCLLISDNDEGVGPEDVRGVAMAQAADDVLTQCATLRVAREEGGYPEISEDTENLVAAALVSAQIISSGIKQLAAVLLLGLD